MKKCTGWNVKNVCNVQECTEWKTLNHVSIIGTVGGQQCDYLSCSLREEQVGERMSTGS